jgi:DNA-directed RNA polymerase specialized sigma24 family protein
LRPTANVEERGEIGADRRAFEGLVRSEHLRLWRFARRLVGDAADDALQDAYVKAYRAFPPGSEGDLRAWLTTIVYRSSHGSP